ncbi:MAG: hypothetical protein R3F19_31270 [Verrucomicrobiales bacterium]
MPNTSDIHTAAHRRWDPHFSVDARHVAAGCGASNKLLEERLTIKKRTVLGRIASPSGGEWEAVNAKLPSTV